MSGAVLVAPADGILRVTINRPEKRNALSRAVLDELGQVFAGHAPDEALRVAVLTAAGSHSFAAGGDLLDLAAVRTREGAAAMATQARTALDAIRRFPVPVVAALNGVALGGGAELAVACDLRIAAAHAGIGFVQGRLNIVTAWGGGIDLMRLLGPARGLAVSPGPRCSAPRRPLPLAWWMPSPPLTSRSTFSWPASWRRWPGRRRR